MLSRIQELHRLLFGWRHDLGRCDARQFYPVNRIKRYQTPIHRLVKRTMRHDMGLMHRTLGLPLYNHFGAQHLEVSQSQALLGV